MWMPGAGFKRRALEVARYVRAWKETGYGMVKAALVSLLGLGRPRIDVRAGMCRLVEK